MLCLGDFIVAHGSLFVPVALFLSPYFEQIIFELLDVGISNFQ